jgi:hypothetical protein
MITGEYFIPVDTLENYQQSVKAMTEEPCLGIRAEVLEGIDVRLEDVDFSGVNAYLRFMSKTRAKRNFWWAECCSAGIRRMAVDIICSPVM